MHTCRFRQQNHSNLPSCTRPGHKGGDEERLKALYVDIPVELPRKLVITEHAIATVSSDT